MNHSTPIQPTAVRLGLRYPFGVITLLALLAVTTVQAQWKKEVFRLDNGWNGIFLHVDAKYSDLNTLLAGTDISEVWMWAPEYTSRQFITSPDNPTNQGSNWLSWQADSPELATLHRLVGNAAYLVKFDGADGSLFEVTGIPVPPRYDWSSAGENFIGISTYDDAAVNGDPGVGPSFDSYFSHEPSLASNLQVFQYNGGPLSPTNPSEVINKAGTHVTRGKAFWMKAPNFNSYFHTFDVTLPNSGGIDFMGTSAQATVRLRNRTKRN